MTQAQRDRLQFAINLIENSLTHDQNDKKIISTWLDVAGDCCNEASEEIEKGNNETT